MSGVPRRLVVGLLVALAPAATRAGLFAPAGLKPHPAVCRVAVEERDGMAFGSGTLIDCREGYGMVVTNWHVVRDAKGKIEVRFPAGFTSEARPLKLDETWDLAALVIWRPPTEPAPLSAQPPRAGDRLTICGYGQGDYLEQTGRCTDYYSPEVGQPQEIVELNVQARQGDSGGPIFNDRGQLAGVLFGAARGTTLGSFGGRVQTFLATLAPDIGVGTPPPTMLAAAPPQPVERTPAIDPFAVAERATPEPPAPSLADRSSAARPAASRHTADAWSPAPSPPPVQQGPSPWLAAKPATQGFAPETSVAPPAAGPVIDWYEDGRTLFALMGVAALVVSGLRALG